MKIPPLVFISSALLSCGIQRTSTTVTDYSCRPYSSSGQSIGATNIIPITVGCGYINQPCVAVKICEPGSNTNCATIDHILLDTGSYGLRLFNCTHSLNLPQQTGNISKTGTTTNGSKTITSISSTSQLIVGHRVSGVGIPASTKVTAISGTTVTISKSATASGAGVALTFNGDVAECVQYADGTSDWGPVKLADVYMAGYKAANIPIQDVNSGYASVPAACGTPEYSPKAAGFNGILGVGLFQYDCPSCNLGSTAAGYYTCIGSACAGYAAPNAVQVVNPITQLVAISGGSTSEQNGVKINMSSVASASGASGVTGNLYLGVDTLGNNDSTGATRYAANANLYFTTTYRDSSAVNRVLTSSFVDCGSNLWNFPDSFMTLCSDGFYCPASTTALQATPAGGPAVPFSIANADSTLASGNTAYSNIGASFPGAFDWGMPFYYGRSIYHVINGKTATTLGSGPAWGW